MIEYLWLLPLSYIALFILYTLIKAINKQTDKLIFCTTCAAYFALLIIGFFLSFPAIIWAFMLGMSISGISEKLDEIITKRKKEFFAQFFILHLVMTIVGLAILIIRYSGGY